MNKILIISSLILILVITGCGTSTNNKNSAVGFIGGTDGLVPKIEIISSQLNQVLDNNVENFQIALTLQNKGETTVKAGDVLTTLSGIDLNAFQIKEKDGTSKSQDQLEKLARDGTKTLPPSETVIAYDANYKYDEPADKTQEIGLNFCYKYETIASTDSCLVKEVTKPSTESKCKVDEQKVMGNSGAPVSVTSLTERPSGKSTVTFTLQIENKGKGDVYSPEFFVKGKCIEDQETKNKFNVKVEFPDGNPKIKCVKFNEGNEGQLSMIQNKALLTCTADTSGLQETAFTKSLRVVLNYIYKDDISTKLTIRSTA